MLTTHRTSKKRSTDDLPLPAEERIAELSRLLTQQKNRETTRNRYASVSRVLGLLGAGAVLSLSLFVAPAAVMLAKPFLDEKRRRDREAWKEFNPRYLRRTIERLRKQKLVAIEEHDSQQIVTLTKNGKRRILKYSLASLTIDKPTSWDGQWRLVLYDVPKNKRHLRDVFRETIKNLDFYQLQESVWLYPFPCEAQITFLREYYGVGNEVLYVVASRLEEDAPYRTYFGL